ncbi:7974_t:CDS:2, partial [Funneliformis mosseae]
MTIIHNGSEQNIQASNPVSFFTIEFASGANVGSLMGTYRSVKHEIVILQELTVSDNADTNQK